MNKLIQNFKRMLGRFDKQEVLSKFNELNESDVYGEVYLTEFENKVLEQTIKQTAKTVPTLNNRK